MSTEAHDRRVDGDLVRASLDSVLSSAQFRSSERIRQFLGYVVEETIAGRADGIKAYSIAVDCFDRDHDFDPQLDPYVRIVARRLRRALKHYYQEDGAGDALRISMPRGSYRPVFSPSTDSSPAGSLPVGLGPRGRRTVAATRSASLAVVRIEQNDDATTDGSFSGGLTHEIVLELGRFHNLEVVGPITAAERKVAETSPGEIGANHRVDFVLMGSVQRQHDRVHVTVNLSEVDSSRMIWSERYDRDVTVENLFAVQEEIAGTVAASIADASGIIVRRGAERTHGRDPEMLSSYEAVLRGLHWNNVVTPEALDEAQVALEHAVATDPRYALAHALLSDIYFADWSSGNDGYPDALTRATHLAESSVHIDRFCSDAHWAMGQVRFGHRDIDGFRNGFDVALELHPGNALHLASYALFLAGLEEWDEATDLLTSATRLNPQLPTWSEVVPAMAHARRGEWLEALASARRIRDRGLLWGPALCAALLGHLDRADESAASIAELLSIKPRFAEHGRELMTRLLYSEGNVAVVLDGLAKAGLAVD